MEASTVTTISGVVLMGSVKVLSERLEVKYWMLVLLIEVFPINVVVRLVSAGVNNNVYCSLY